MFVRKGLIVKCKQRSYCRVEGKREYKQYELLCKLCIELLRTEFTLSKHSEVQCHFRDCQIKSENKNVGFCGRGKNLCYALCKVEKAARLMDIVELHLKLTFR